MRKTILGLTAAAAATTLTANVAAAASTTARTETLSFMDTSNTSQLFRVIATGAFTDAGTILIKGPGRSPGSMRLSRGTIKAQARFTTPPQTKVNTKTCLVTEHSAGTLALLGGTGAHVGITGSGKFSQSAREVLPTMHGRCSLSSVPVGSQQIITASATVPLP